MSVSDVTWRNVIRQKMDGYIVSKITSANIVTSSNARILRTKIPISEPMILMIPGNVSFVATINVLVLVTHTNVLLEIVAFTASRNYVTTLKHMSCLKTVRIARIVSSILDVAMKIVFARKDVSTDEGKMGDVLFAIWFYAVILFSRAGLSAKTMVLTNTHAKSAKLHCASKAGTLIYLLRKRFMVMIIAKWLFVQRAISTNALTMMCTCSMKMACVRNVLKHFARQQVVFTSYLKSISVAGN